MHKLPESLERDETTVNYQVEAFKYQKRTYECEAMLKQNLLEEFIQRKIAFYLTMFLILLVVLLVAFLLVNNTLCFRLLMVLDLHCDFFVLLSELWDMRCKNA